MEKTNNLKDKESDKGEIPGNKEPEWMIILREILKDSKIIEVKKSN